ncbi:hypothetical protein ABEB36_013621 [Hypothenemus hampei]|uniref:Uncharacterized protein n=1 Tax=Hypothenemus hampei TaxID=57062 RepID=A0ABD1E7I9_HYPHA
MKFKGGSKNISRCKESVQGKVIFLRIKNFKDVTCFSERPLEKMEIQRDAFTGKRLQKQSSESAKRTRKRYIVYYDKTLTNLDNENTGENENIENPEVITAGTVAAEDRPVRRNIKKHESSFENEGLQYIKSRNTSDANDGENFDAPSALFVPQSAVSPCTDYTDLSSTSQARSQHSNLSTAAWSPTSNDSSLSDVISD